MKLRGSYKESEICVSAAGRLLGARRPGLSADTYLCRLRFGSQLAPKELSNRGADFLVVSFQRKVASVIVIEKQVSEVPGIFPQQGETLNTLVAFDPGLI